MNRHCTEDSYEGFRITWKPFHQAFLLQPSSALSYVFSAGMFGRRLELVHGSSRPRMMGALDRRQVELEHAAPGVDHPVRRETVLLAVLPRLVRTRRCMPRVHGQCFARVFPPSITVCRRGFLLPAVFPRRTRPPLVMLHAAGTQPPCGPPPPPPAPCAPRRPPRAPVLLLLRRGPPRRHRQKPRRERVVPLADPIADPLVVRAPRTRVPFSRQTFPRLHSARDAGEHVRERVATLVTVATVRPHTVSDPIRALSWNVTKRERLRFRPRERGVAEPRALGGRDATTAMCWQ